jgi:hypothetical protein
VRDSLPEVKRTSAAQKSNRECDCVLRQLVACLSGERDSSERVDDKLPTVLACVRSRIGGRANEQHFHKIGVLSGSSRKVTSLGAMYRSSRGGPKKYCH